MSEKEIVLKFVDEVMEDTVKGHEALCDEDKCSIEEPCAYCLINDILMAKLAKIDA
jgi:hypothetical protein